VTRARTGLRPPGALRVPAILAIAFLALPLAGLVTRAPWSALPGLISSAPARDALRLSLVCSLGAVAICLVLGVPLAWLLAREPRLPGRGVLRAVVLVPLVLPPVVGGTALLLAFGRRGVLGGTLAAVGVRLPFTTAGAMLAEAFVALPFLVLTVEGALAGLDPRYEEVAATLGASGWVTFRRVSLPLLGPALTAGAVLAWARALGEFGATITFAGSFPGRTETLPLAVYLDLTTDPATGIAESVLLLGVSLVVLLALRGRWVIRR